MLSVRHNETPAQKAACLFLFLAFLISFNIIPVFPKHEGGGLGLVPERGQFSQKPSLFSKADHDLQILHIHVPAYFHEKKIKNFAQISNDELGEIKNQGFNAVWLMGVWGKSEFSKKHNLSHENPDLPGRTASLFSVPDYQIDPEMGGEAQFRDLVARASAQGIKVFVDFIPTHLAVDSPWIDKHPDWFQQIKMPRKFWRFLPEYKNFLKKLPDETEVLFSHANNNEFFMKDTAMLNLFNPEVWRFLEASLEKMAELTQSGGVRIDMITELYPATVRWKFRRNMSVSQVEKELDRVSLAAFGEKPKKPGAVLEAVIKRIKAKYPEFIFIGETYQGQEAFWQAVGVDLTYAKFVYDWLVLSWNGGPAEFKEYLFRRGGYRHVSDDFVRRSVYFLESHDERKRFLGKLYERFTVSDINTILFRKVFKLPLEQWIQKRRERIEAEARLIAVTTATIPGVPVIYYGQTQGKKGNVPSATWFSKQITEASDLETEKFYRELLNQTKQPLFRTGEMKEIPLLKGDGKSMIVFSRFNDVRFAVVALNYAPKPAHLELDLKSMGLSPDNQEFDLPPFGYRISVHPR